jgi:hypothetical protein
MTSTTTLFSFWIDGLDRDRFLASKKEKKQLSSQFRWMDQTFCVEPNVFASGRQINETIAKIRYAYDDRV